MKKNEPLGRYPYRCPDCPELQPYKSRVMFARHRAARHSVIVAGPSPAGAGRPVLEALPLYLNDFELSGHGHGALPTLDAYDETAR